MVVIAKPRTTNPVMMCGRSVVKLNVSSPPSTICTKIMMAVARKMMSRISILSLRLSTGAFALAKLAYGAGSTSTFGKFDMRAIGKDVHVAEENGCRFYVVPFPQEDYIPKMREFATDLLPSYSSNQPLVTQ